MKTRKFYALEQKKQKNILKNLVLNQEGITFASSKIKNESTTLSPTAARSSRKV